MPLFRSRKHSSSSPLPINNTPSQPSSPAPPPPPRRSNSVVSVTSNDSLKSNSSSLSTTHKLKSFFKSNHNNEDNISHLLDNKLNIAPDSRSNSASPIRQEFRPEYKKRISTIAENSSICSTDYEDSQDGSSSSSSSSSSSCCSYLDDDVIHVHPIKIKKYSPDQQHHDITKLLSSMVTLGFKKNFKNYKELKEFADLESKQTYSLLDSDNKIHKISKNLNGSSIIDTPQISLIKNLASKIEKIIKYKKYDLIINEKSLYERYGTVKQVIGKGAYGLIKIIDPDTTTANPTPTTSLNVNQLANSGKTLYAVKQWFPRKNESQDNFIERILSEFVIQSTLNNNHLLNSVDLMCELPTNYSQGNLQFSQVLPCNLGGDLYSYLMNPMDINNNSISYVSLDEIDCWIKQITLGLNYMHNHGVSHCDLKLENILISYKPNQDPDDPDRTRMVLKISDFGKSFVFKTKFDTDEQMLSGSNGLIGTLPYIPPEEFITVKSKSEKPFSSIKKDCWCLGILIVVLFNIRRYYYSGMSSSVELDRRFRYLTRDYAIENLKNNEYSNDDDDDDEKEEEEEECYGRGFLWECTDIKSLGSKFYKDKLFGEYVNKRMIANYDSKTKEWLIKRQRKFKPIDEICNVPNSDNLDMINDDNNDDLNELRIMIIYKLLDIEPNSRMNTKEFLTSDWLDNIDIC